LTGFATFDAIEWFKANGGQVPLKPQSKGAKK
jgi:hypothetical protein